jgi:hypothetical protein
MQHLNLDESGRIWKWAIHPHPYNQKDFDVFITNDDQEAKQAILYAAENYLWDSIKPNQSKSLTVSLNLNYTII